MSQPPAKKYDSSEDKSVARPADKSVARPAQNSTKPVQDAQEISISNRCLKYANEAYFGMHQNIPIRYTEESIYSTTPKLQSEYIANLLLAFFPKEQLKTMTLFDGSACIGGNSWTFAKLVKHVRANEVSKVSYDILKHNMSVLKVDNIEVTNENIVNLASSDDSNIVFLDPPWGGPNYKENKTSLLFYSCGRNMIEVADLIKSEFTGKDLVMVKLPKNYDYDRLLNIFPFIYRTDISTVLNKEARCIYKIVMLSKTQMIKKLEKQLFEPLRYRSIEFHAL